MISKETFINIMERLEALNKKMDAVDVAMKALCRDFCSFYVLEPFDIITDILSEVFHDKKDWLAYFIYERDWLHDYTLGDVIINGEAVKIENWGDVYDFLMRNMED